MFQTIADDTWGRPCLAYHVQPHLASETRSALVGLQEAVASRWTVPLFLTPPEALHVTLYALVQVKGIFDKEGYWSSIAEPCRSLLEESCRGHGPLELRFTRLKVTDTAIIAVATDETGLIDRVRNAIAAEIPPPPGHEPIRYDLIHSTLARYRTSDAVPEAAVAAVEAIPASVAAPVERLKIIRETLFPCRETDELFSVSLC
ncbi:2'-5' RNA ligase family protein [Microvirga makkahensis]|uniref:2'-5' RNA ligase superfamily protein n=1 Tax=Microvirga makkahensis TaxID=1128670 RepID=A0A7X3MNT5_9HYPH|nr:2'-5' RNA ligase family protein [Microvirga makkahensis]MXQ10395.1 hypothetical protein [Microvirga makkahensis]